MSSVDDLVAWLRAQIDEDERVAKAATAGPWWYNPAKAWHLPDDLPTRRNGEEFVGANLVPSVATCVAATGPADHPQSMADAQFIARHDPARVLREVESKRRILDALPSDDGYDAGRAKFSDYESCDDSCVGQVMHEVVKLLALPYADRPGYQEEWKP